MDWQYMTEMAKIHRELTIKGKRLMMEDGTMWW